MKRTKAISGTVSGDEQSRRGLAPQVAAKVPVLLRAHLWMADGRSNRGHESESEPEGAGVPQPALTMVADLLQVRGGEPRESGAGLIAASFPDAVQAVNAARNLQRLLQGFARAWPGGALGGCTILARMDEAGGGIDAGLLRGNQALQQTHPGQVLFVGGLCEAARSIPGLKFHSFSGTGLGPAANGVGRQVLHLLAPEHMEGFVEEPFEPRVLAEEGRPPAMEVAARPLPPSGATAAPPAHAAVSTPVSAKSPAAGSTEVPFRTTRTMPAVQAALAERNEIGAFSREEKTARGGFSRWAIVGGAAAVLLAGVLILTSVLRRSSHATAAPAQPASGPATPAPVANPAPAADAGKSDSGAPASETRTPPPQVASAKTKGSDAARGKGTTHAAAAGQQEAAEPAEETHGARGLTFTPAEISSLIAHADKDSGDGKFDKAIQEYRIVLRQDPANEAATRGLQKALYNKEHK